MHAQPQLQPHDDDDPKKVLTVAQLARRIGWSTRRTRRFLVARDRELGGTLLVNVGRGSKPRWTVTTAAIKQVAGAWYKDPEATDRALEFLNDELLNTQDAIATLSRRLTREHQMIMALAEREGRAPGRS